MRALTTIWAAGTIALLAGGCRIVDDKPAQQQRPYGYYPNGQPYPQQGYPPPQGYTMPGQYPPPGGTPQTYPPQPATGYPPPQPAGYPPPQPATPTLGAPQNYPPQTYPQTTASTGGWNAGSAHAMGLVRDLSPTTGPIGTGITIMGVGFPTDGSVGLTFVGDNNTAASGHADSVTVNRIDLTVPPGAASGRLVVTSYGKPIGEARFNVSSADSPFTQPVAAGHGLVGQVWAVPPSTQRLPDFATLGAPLTTVVVGNLDISPRDFGGLAAPGQTLSEWLGVRFFGTVQVQTGGTYYLRLTSVDGARLAIDGAWVIDNDGLHAAVSKTGTVQLTAGPHRIALDYFRGSRGSPLNLQLYWTPPGGYEMAVPADQISRL